MSSTRILHRSKHQEDDEELNGLRQAALNSLENDKSDNLTDVYSSNSSNTRKARVRSRLPSRRNNDGPMGIPPVHNRGYYPGQN